MSKFGFNEKLSSPTKTVFFQCQFVSGGSGRIVVSLKVEPEHCNNYGTLHGGLSAVLVDSISTLALMPDDEKTNPRFGVSVDMHMRQDSIIPMAKLLAISINGHWTVAVAQVVENRPSDLNDRSSNPPPSFNYSVIMTSSVNTEYPLIVWP